MKIVTGDQMRLIDKMSVDEYGIPSLMLMENAGIKMVQQLLDIYPEMKDESKFITVIVGPGNNGGDGLVIARQLYNIGIEPFVVVLGSEDKYKGDSLVNLNIAKNLELYLSFTPDESCFDQHKKKILGSDFIIDAIFGTGLKGSPRDFQSYVIKELNEKYNGIVVSVDLPSGMVSNYIAKSDVIIKADDTLCVSLPKINMVDYPGKEYVGNLHIVNIGFPDSLLEDTQIKSNLVFTEDAKLLLDKRVTTGHKGTFGRVLIVAGSNEYTGAGALTSISALKAGAGLVTLISEKSVCETVRCLYPEIICYELHANSDDNVGNIYEKNLDLIKNHLEKSDCFVVGPGVSSHSMFSLIMDCLSSYTGKTVMDAGVINFLSKEPHLLNKTASSIVLTPHIMEFSRLNGKSISEINNNKVEILSEFCSDHNVSVVLKSAVTMFCDADGNLYYNSTGNNALASGGTGDVLTGMIGGFSAQGYSLSKASIISIFLHGLTADLLVKEETEHTVTATSIVNNMHRAFMEVKNHV